MSLKDFDIIVKLGNRFLIQAKEHTQAFIKYTGTQTDKSTH